MIRSAVFALAILMAAPGSAAIVKVRYDGVVGNSSSLTNVFGDVPTLTGLTYRADLVYDTSLGNLVEGPGYSFRQGGPLFGGSNPFLSGSLTINGVTVDLMGGNYSQIGGWSTPSFSQTYHDTNYNVTADGFQTENWLVQYINIYSEQIPLDIDGPLDFTATPADQGVGYFSIFQRNVDTNQYLSSANGDLIPNRVRISLLSSNVPEAPTWALYILGFGVVGTTLRRRTPAAA